MGYPAPLQPVRVLCCLVDCTQGIQAQTISNLYLAIEHDREIIPIVNKIDMDGAMIEETKDQIVDLIGCDPRQHH